MENLTYNPLPDQTAKIQAESHRFLRFLIAASLALFLALTLGYLLRFDPPGSACPDWPTCYGQLALPETAAARLDMAHRVISALAALLVAGATVWAFLRRGERRWLRLSLTAASLIMAAQVLIGRGLVLVSSSGDWSGAAHQGLALLAMALVSLSAVGSAYPAQDHPIRRATRPERRLRRTALAALTVVFGLMLTGALTASLGANDACRGWPMCGGIFPPAGLSWLFWLHRLAALAGAGLTLSLLYQAWKIRRRSALILSAAATATVLLFGQVFIGALKVARDYPLDLAVLHAISAAGLWVTLVILAAAARFEPAPAEDTVPQNAPQLRAWARLGALVALNKPIIIALLLVTTYAGMVVGGKQIPPFWLTLWTLIGGALAAGGSSALNQYIDREIDGRMQRTSRRPLPSGRLQPAEALAYGIAACLTAFFLMAGMVNLLAAALSLAGMIYYVLVYSILLKKATVQNIVIGGGAGAIPPLVGWAAVTGSLNVPSLFLFALIFLWTPPHFWALALVRSKDYARAGVPMLPVVKGEKATRTQIFIYTLELVGLTLLMPVFNIAGGLFLISAAVLGLWLIYAAWNVLRKPGNRVAFRMYRYSSMYLAFIFLALVLDVLI